MFSKNSILESLSKFLKLDNLTETLTGYVEARVQLLKIEVREDIAKAITRALVFAVIILLAFLFIIFFSLATALFINRYFNENYLGFLIVGGFYLTSFVLSLAFRNQLFKKLDKLFTERLNNKE